MEILSLVGRILFGGFFVMNGFNHFAKFGMMKGYAESKRVPAASFAIIVSGLMLLLGGLGVLFGWYVDISMWLIVVFLFFVSFKMHDFWNDSDPQMKMNNMINFTKNFALLGAALMFLA